MKEPAREPASTVRERSAEEKLALITPLLIPGLDHKEIVRIKKEIAEREGISYRTMGRYLTAWQSEGFEGLKPKPPWNSGKTDTIPNMDEVVKEAISLRLECPERSVKDIILILEMEGWIKPGSIRRSTLQRQLYAAGYSAKRVRSGCAKGKASRRFQKEHRNELWQSDIKYGPYLPIGEDGKMKQVYLCVFLDDRSRFIVSAGFYASQDSDMVEDCLRQGIMRYGKPDVLYVDNGKQYSTKWLARACRALGIVLIHTKPYDPEAKGKVEAFNHRVNTFLSEAALAKPQTLDELNRHLANWIEEYYHKSAHRALGQLSPRTVYTMDARPLEFVDNEKLREAFVHVVERHADKTGCVSFAGKLYEAGMRFAGRKVEVVYDPAYLDEIEIHMKDAKPVTARPMEVGPFCGYERDGRDDRDGHDSRDGHDGRDGQDSRDGVGKDALAVKGSRMLDALNRANITFRTNSGIATSFRKTREMEGTKDV